MARISLARGAVLIVVVTVFFLLVPSGWAGEMLLLEVSPEKLQAGERVEFKCRLWSESGGARTRVSGGRLEIQLYNRATNRRAGNLRASPSGGSDVVVIPWRPKRPGRYRIIASYFNPRTRTRVFDQGYLEVLPDPGARKRTPPPTTRPQPSTPRVRLTLLRAKAKPTPEPGRFRIEVSLTDTSGRPLSRAEVTVRVTSGLMSPGLGREAEVALDKNGRFNLDWLVEVGTDPAPRFEAEYPGGTDGRVRIQPASTRLALSGPVLAGLEKARQADERKKRRAGKRARREAREKAVAEAHQELNRAEDLLREGQLDLAEGLIRKAESVLGRTGLVGSLKKRLAHLRSRAATENQAPLKESPPPETNTSRVDPLKEGLSEDEGGEAVGVDQGRVITNRWGMKFRLIPSGSYKMGSSPEKKGPFDSSPDRMIEIENPFRIGVYEVTQAEWRKIMGNNPSKFKRRGARRPVDSVTWPQIRAFLKRLSRQDRNYSYRLPTEAEWEYAARAGTETAYSFGNDPRLLDDYACFIGTSGMKTRPVGLGRPNPWGLYDIHGNVSEVCTAIPPDGETGGEPKPIKKADLIKRGGSWMDGINHLRSAARLKTPFGYAVGIRLIMEED